MSSPPPIKSGEFGDTKDSPVNQVSFPLNKSRFTEFLVRENALDAFGFQEWVFYPGMLFHSMDKWWANSGKRDKPHEGLDLCFYRDPWNNIFCLDENVKIPVLYDGVIAKIVDDFMGKSIFVKHHLLDNHPSSLYTIYGHTNPLPGLHERRIVKEGEILATLAPSGQSKSPIPSHLHLSLGWTSEAISYENLDWKTIGTSDGLKWVDPLRVIRRDFNK